MQKLSRILTLVLLILGGVGLTSCNEFFEALFGNLDNSVSPQLQVSETTITVKEGQTKRCMVKASTMAKLTWATADENIATVDQNGLVTGVCEGVTSITVTATNPDTPDYFTIFYDETAVINVVVTAGDDQEVKQGTISYAATSIGKTFGDEPFINPLTKTGNGKVTYLSSNTAVATVNSETGEVTIKGNGETTITATVEDTDRYTYEKKTASYTLGVGTATMTASAEGYIGTYDGSAHGITVTVISPADATVKYGTKEGTYNLDASPTYSDVGSYTVYYQVTMEGYTAVSGSATVVINKATMTASAEGYVGTYDGSAHGITVTVPSGASVKYGTEAGTYDKTSLTYTDAGTYTVYYEATMDNYTSVTGSATVIISKAAGTISFKTTSIAKKNTDAAFTNALTKTGDGTVTYASSNTKVATVNSSTGEVTIMGAGETTITATATDGTNYAYATPTAEYTLTVSAESSGVDRDGYENGDNPF